MDIGKQRMYLASAVAQMRNRMICAVSLQDGEASLGQSLDSRRANKPLILNYHDCETGSASNLDHPILNDREHAGFSPGVPIPAKLRASAICGIVAAGGRRPP